MAAKTKEVSPSLNQGGRSRNENESMAVQDPVRADKVWKGVFKYKKNPFLSIGHGGENLTPCYPNVMLD